MKELKILSSLYRNSLKSPLKDLVVRQERLRVSGFPYCGLKSAFTKMRAKTVGEKEEDTNSGKEHFTGTGTNMHLVFQRWMGNTGTVLGNWKCYNKDCGHEKRLSRSNKCPKCKSEMEYIEIDVKMFKHVSGHIDGVWRSPEGKYFVIDYKTTSTRMLASPMLPYAKNVAQITSYCFHPETFVQTNKGLIPILEICKNVENYSVLSYNHKTNKTEFKEIAASSIHPPEEDMYEIEYEGGKLKVTASHKLWSVTRKAYVEVQHLLEGEEVLAV